MSAPRERLSPIKKMKAALVRSPKSSKFPQTPRSPTSDPGDHAGLTGPEPETEPDPDPESEESRIEDMYFQDPKSRECLSSNPGEYGKYRREQMECTVANYNAEIQRRHERSDMIDHAYDKSDPLRTKAYGHGDGQK